MRSSAMFAELLPLELCTQESGRAAEVFICTAFLPLAPPLINEKPMCPGNGVQGIAAGRGRLTARSLIDFGGPSDYLTFYPD